MSQFLPELSFPHMYRMTLSQGDFRQITYGQRLVSHAIAGFQLVETRHEPNQLLTRHAHADASINFVIAGRLVETLGSIYRRRPFDCVPGTLLFKPADESHMNSYGPSGATCFIVQPSSERLDRLIDSRVKVNQSAFTARADAASLVRRIRYEMHTDDDLSSMAIEGYSLELFALLAGRPRRSTKAIWLRRAQRHLVENSRHKIALGDLASALEVDPAVLSRQFREAFGITPSAFVRRERTRWAACQLTAGRCSLSEIAADAGFVDQSHFTRSFRQEYGVTPHQFRRITRYS